MFCFHLEKHLIWKKYFGALFIARLRVLYIRVFMKLMNFHEFLYVLHFHEYEFCTQIVRISTVYILKDALLF